MLTSQRIEFNNWEVVPDLSRAVCVGGMMSGLVGIPGIISHIWLIANRDYFGPR